MISPDDNTRLLVLSFYTLALHLQAFCILLHLQPFISVGNLLCHHPCLMSNFLQDALRALNDEELERFIRWLKMERELRIVNLRKQAARSHEPGSSARQCLHACRYCSKPCIFKSFSANHSEMHDHTDWHRCHLHWYREGCMVMTFAHHTHSYPIWGTVCVSPSDSKEESFAFLLFSFFSFCFQSQGDRS